MRAPLLILTAGILSIGSSQIVGPTDSKATHATGSPLSRVAHTHERLDERHTGATIPPDSGAPARGETSSTAALAAPSPGAGSRSSTKSGAPVAVFTDVTDEARIRFTHSFGDDDLSNIVEGTGSGAMFFDYDGDGWLDVYFANGAWLKGVNDARGRRLEGALGDALYRNNRDGTFTDVTERAGVAERGASFGVSAADYDGDGDLDVYVQNYGPNVLYRNEGDGTFTDVSARSGLADPRWSVSAPWLDYDGDGDLDVFVANYLEYDDGKFRAFYAAAGYPGPLSYSGQPDALYRNNGDGTFTDVSKDAGIVNPDGRAMSASAMDLDGDGFLDLYVANDATANDYFESTGRGTFESKGLFTGLAFGEAGQGVSSMGPAPGDVNRDGLIDLFIPDMGYGTLLVNLGGDFEDRTTRSGLAIVCGQYTGWAGLLFDADNDADVDLFVTNGDAHHEYPEEDVMALNDGEGSFTDVAPRSGAYFATKRVGRGASYGDYDNDGDPDLLVVNLHDRAVLLRNDLGPGNSWLTVRALLPNGKSDAVGARVTVTTGSLRQIEEVTPVRGYLSQVDPRPHFGIGAAARADVVEIRWPDRTVTRLDDVPANQILTVVKDAR